MPVPKRKRSKARRDKRFANKGLKLQTAASCNNCQAPLQAHSACLGCGFYKGSKVLRTKGERLETRQQERAAKQANAKQAAAAQQAVVEPEIEQK